MPNDGRLTNLHMHSHPKENIRKETCWAMSNMTAGTVQQVQAVIDHNIVPMLLETLKKDTYRVRKEAAWAVNNIVNGGTEAQVKYADVESLSEGRAAPYSSGASARFCLIEAGYGVVVGF